MERKGSIQCPSNVRALIGLEESGYDVTNVPSGPFTCAHAVGGKYNNNYDNYDEKGKKKSILEHLVTSVSICSLKLTHVFTYGVTFQGNSRKHIYCSVQRPPRRSMCEHCDVVEGVLDSLLGTKSTAVVMKLVKARLHSSSENELNNAVSH
jgi:hypothetical protein